MSVATCNDWGLAVLTLWAALVPILASLAVAVWMLISHARQRRKVWAFEEAWAQYRRDEAEIDLAGAERAIRQQKAENVARRQAFLKKHGIDPIAGSRDAMDKPGAPVPPSPVPLWQEGILMLGAVVGAVLVAIEVARQ